MGANAAAAALAVASAATAAATAAVSILILGYSTTLEWDNQFDHALVDFEFELIKSPFLGKSDHAA